MTAQQPLQKNQTERLLPNNELADIMNAVLQKGAPFQFQATGHSMWPLIRDGDTVTIAPLPPDGPRLGDVVACAPTNSRRLFLHRVVRVQNSSVVLQGDNAYAPDGTFSTDEILGIVTDVKRSGHTAYLGFGPERRIIAWLAYHPRLRRLFIRLAHLLQNRCLQRQD